MLVQGDDDALKKVAVLDLQSKDALAIADAWNKVKGGQDRAVYWYKKALPALSGLQKARAEKLVKEWEGASESNAVRTVSVWEHHWGQKNNIANRIFWSDGSIDVPASTDKWEKNGQTLIIRWANGFVDTVAISSDGQSFDGHNQHGGHLWGKLISGQSGPGVVAVWAHQFPGGSDRVICLADGHLYSSNPKHSGTWESKGHALLYHWSNGSIDSLVLSKDGQSYTGHNLKGTPVSGKLIANQ
jgi:hypothetical protein